MGRIIIFIFLVLLGYLLIKRWQDKKNENFEDRDN